MLQNIKPKATAPDAAIDFDVLEHNQFHSGLALGAFHSRTFAVAFVCPYTNRISIWIGSGGTWSGRAVHRPTCALKTRTLEMAAWAKREIGYCFVAGAFELHMS
jgi:hypothetical protein